MKRLLLTLFTIFLTTQLQAQTADEAVELLEDENGTGLRATALGNAFTAVADDYSAIYWNPAGLAQIRQGQVSASLYNSAFNNRASYLGSELDDSRTFTKFQSFGMVYPFPVVRGSFVLALGYQKVRDFDDFVRFSGFNTESNGLTFLYGETGNYDEYPFDRNIRQSHSLFTDGNLSQWSLGGAIDLSPNFSAGLTLSFYGGSSSYTSDYLQEDINNVYTSPIDFDQYTYQQKINSDYSGFELKAGGLFHLSKNIRLGTVITFPTSITVDESWSENDVLRYDNGDTEAYDLGAGEYDYIIKVPFKFSAGLAFHNRFGLLSGSVDYRDWSQLKYDSPSDRDPADYSDLLDENKYLRSDYRAVLSYSVGSELNILNTGLLLRGGYRYVPSPLKNQGTEFDKTYYSFGLGYVVDGNTSVDMSYVRGSYERRAAYYNNNPNVWETEESIETTKLLFGLKFHF